MLRLTARRLAELPRPGTKLQERPIISRTRSWRGLMQVRHDDTRHDYKYMMKQFFFYSPIRVGGSGILTATIAYFYLGHDGFMYHLFGYESEAAVEQRPLNRPAHGIGELLFADRKMINGIRSLEDPKTEEPAFNVYVPPAQAEATTLKL